MASMALMIRLRITCCSWTRSPGTGGKPSASSVCTDDAVLHRFATGQLDHLADRLVDLHRLVAPRRLLDERANPADDVAGAVAVLDDAAERLRGPPPDPAADAPSQRSAAWALVTVAAIGWLTSWAIEAVSCPIVATRLACASSICTSR